MNTTVRFCLSIFALAAGAFTIAASVFAGPAASVTVFSFGVLAVYGLLEIALVSYVPASPVRVRKLPPVTTPAVARRARVSAVVEYSAGIATRRAA
jgi:hypothetical protein